MPDDSAKRLNHWSPLNFAIILALGILIGFFLNKYLGNKRSMVSVANRNDRLEEIINIVDAKYLNTVNTDSLYNDAINGILSHLDPHTVYIPAREMATVTEEMEGNFKGIGIDFFVLNDTIMVTSVLKNSPSAEAGLLAGDKVISVNDNLVAGVQITIESIISKLRGLDGSVVRLQLLRATNPHVFIAEVKRGTIPIYSIDAAYMITPNTGYIRINRFSATTYREFNEAMQALLKKGMRQLMLDLRQNPGGYVDAATAILDQFISKDKLLVYTQGRSTGKEEYIAAKTGKFEQGKLIVLVDETSASASEIVAGAVQDWDRGVIIGRRTYGKGLVQEQIELEDGSALRLTVAQYFTPSGRNIQRPFDKGKLAYEQDFETRYLNGSLTQKDTSINTDTTKYITAVRKRVVYGGGGIKPDIEVPYDVHQYSKTLYQYINADEFMNAVYTYFAGHSTTFNVYKSFNQFDASFNVSESVLQEIKKISEKAGYKHNLWEDTRDIAQLKLSIKAVIARMLFRSNGYFQEINKKDAMVNRALDIINSREYTAIIGG